MHVVSAFVDGDAPKTKAALATLDAITQAKRVLVVLDRDDVLNWVSLRNVPQVHLIEAGQLNTYDVLVADEVVFTETALAEYVAGPVDGQGPASCPTSTTPRHPGRPSPRSLPQGEGTDGPRTAAEAPAKKAAAKKARQPRRRRRRRPHRPTTRRPRRPLPRRRRRRRPRPPRPRR